MRNIYISALRFGKSNFASSAEIWRFTTARYVSCDGDIHRCSTAYRTLSAVLYPPRRYYLTGLILFCDLSLFSILRFVTPTLVGGSHSIRAHVAGFSKPRFIRAFDQFLEWISATRLGQNLLSWPHTDTTSYTPVRACVYSGGKKKTFPANWSPAKASERTA